MMKKEEIDWKLILLQRWAGEYRPAGENDTDFYLKSSVEIADDLSNAGRFSADEVTKFLAVSGYTIVFEGGYPFWKIKQHALKRIEEK